MPATVSHTARTFPFGEEMAAQHAGGAYATRYKFYSLSRTCFGSKELDPQTGYYYYGARYYDPVVSRWLSVDNLASHPNQVDKSPYAYAWNNPVYYTDPDGNCPICVEALEIIVDVGFVLYDLGKLAYDKTTTGETKEEDWAALGADLVAVVLPLTTGAGIAVRASYRALGKSLTKLGIRNVSKNLARVLREARVVKLVIREGQAGKGVIVIGENMQRVNKVAGEIGAETFNAVEYYAKKYKMSVNEAYEEIAKKGQEFWKKGGEGYQLNREWMEEMMKKGKTIIDIGEDPARDYRSIFYAMEKEVTKNYGKMQEIKLK